MIRFECLHLYKRTCVRSSEMKNNFSYFKFTHKVLTEKLLLHPCINTHHLSLLQNPLSQVYYKCAWEDFRSFPRLHHHLQGKEKSRLHYQVKMLRNRSFVFVASPRKFRGLKLASHLHRISHTLTNAFTFFFLPNLNFLPFINLGQL